MTEKTEKKRVAILGVLRGASGPVSSAEITEELRASGHDISDRTVRLYLKSMDQEGLTVNFGRKGRAITESGVRELESSKVIEKAGLLSAKIDQMAYAMDFDLEKKTGNVVMNVSFLRPEQLVRSAPMMMKVFEKGYGMGRLLALFESRECIGGIAVPDQMVGVATVCSITLNGVLLEHGIPTVSRFGGLLQIRDGEATRFVEMITYDGTSLDPLEVFIGGGMTDYTGAITSGTGRIAASFREFPAVSRDRVSEIAGQLDDIGLGGLMRIGWPGQPLLEIPVHEGRVGAIIIGGLNPIATVEERGERVFSRALAGLAEYGRLFPYEELADRSRGLL